MTKFITALITLSLAAAAGFGAYAAENAPPKQVRMIIGNERIGLWEQEYSSAAIKALLSNSNIVVLPEFVSLSTEEDARFALFAENESLRDSPADLIIAVGQSASSFVNQWRDRFFNAIPKLYVIPDNETRRDISANNSGSVLASTIEIAVTETLQVMPRILPDLVHIYIVSGNGVSDIPYLQRVQEIIGNMNLAQEIHYLTGLTPDELIVNLNAAPPNSAVLITTYTEDRTGQPHNAEDIVGLVSSQIEQPIFGVIDSLLEFGIVGGNLTSATLYGEVTAQMAFSILFEEAPIIAPDSATLFAFDQAQLERWDIDQSLLPENSEVINNNPSIVEQYLWQILIVLATVIILLSTVIALARALRKQNKAEQERDQKIVEQLKQERLFESVINSIPDAILITDSEECIFESNNSVEAVFGFRREELLGMSVNELIHSNVAEKKIKGGIIQDVEHSREPRVLIFEKKNGESFSGETIATQITDGAGEVLGHFALIRDVSRRLSLEEEQRQGQKMEALGGLVGGISHDFNNILGVISGYAELSLHNDSPAALEVNQNNILKATDRAKALIAQIMTFSRDSNIGQKPTDLAALLDDTMKLIQVAVPSNIEIDVQKGKGVRAIMGSVIQLQQIILNLTTNAHQSMASKGGSITIALGREEVDREINLSHGVLSSGHYTVLSISDTGPGMSEDIAAKVFNPYFTTKPQGEGSGMGLAIVYRLLKSHGAILDMQTAPGKGLCISMYFEEATGNTAVLDTDTDKENEVVQGKGEHILLVDDDEDLLEAIKQLLSRANYQVTAFNEPIEALKAFRQTPKNFDLLVSDQSMPKLTGVQLLREARAYNPVLPAIICTGYSELLDQQDVAHLTLSSIVKKPYTLSEISGAVADALGKGGEAGAGLES